MRQGWIRLLVVAALTGIVAAGATAVAASGASRHDAAARPPRIGVKHAFGKYSRGWGHVQPKRLFNGGDASGDITHIHWTTWGGPVATGHGRNPIFKPKGGYYKHQARIELRAKRLRHCHGRLTYSKLRVREPRRPHGPYGKWMTWTSYHRNLCTRFH